MAQTKKYRILSFAVMAVVLTALLAVTAFAEITGGYGQILGLEEGEYQARPVTIDTTGTGKAYGSAFSLDESTNKNLAGLYEVSLETDVDFASSTLVYVYGKYADREALYAAPFSAHTTYITTGDKEAVTFAPGYIYSRKGCQAGTIISGVKTLNFNNAYSKDDITSLVNAIATDEKTVAEVRSDVLNGANKSRFSGFHTSYGFTTQEIVPIKDVKSYSYSVKGMSNAGGLNFTYENNTMRLVAYVMDNNGTVTPYTYDDTGKTLTTADYTMSTVDFTSWTALPEEGYLVGITLYPTFGMDNGANFTTITASDVDSLSGTGIMCKLNGYEINVPSLAAPELNGTVLSGFITDATYTIESLGINSTGDGVKAISTETVTGVNSKDLGENAAGLYRITAELESEYFVVPSATIYVKGANRTEIAESINSDVATGMDGSGKFVIGKVSSNATSYGRQGNITNVAYGGRHATGPLYGNDYQKPFVEATDSTEKDNAFATIKSTLEGSTFKYGYNPDEIVPISEVYSYTFGLKAYYNGKSSVTYTNNTVAFKALVLNKDGVVSTHTYLFENDTYDTSSKTYDVNFKAATGWSPALPSDGWLIGFQVNPWYSITSQQNLKITSSDGTYGNVGSFFLHYYNDYILEENRPIDPMDNFAVNGTVISGLYPRATYTIESLGINTSGNGLKVVSTETVTGIESKDLGENAAGLYRITPTAVQGSTMLETSPATIYVKGDLDARLNILSIIGTNTSGVQASDSAKFTPGLISCPQTSYGKRPVPSGHNAWSVGPNGTYMYASNTRLNGVLTATEENKATYFESLKTTFSGYNFTYAFKTQEIVPISDVYSYKFGLKGYNESGSTVEITNLDVEFIAYVADANGTVTPYTYLIENTVYNTELKTYNVNFKATTGWTPALPQNGWLVAIRVKPFAGIDSVDDINITLNEGVTSCKRIGTFFFHYYNDYFLKENVPTPAAEVKGVNFELDGTINIKLNFEYDADKASDFTLALTQTGAISNTVYTAEEAVLSDDGKTGYFIIKVLPKDALTLSLGYTFNYDGAASSTTGTLSVPAIVTKYEDLAAAEGEDEYDAVLPLIDALKTYYTYANYYFNGVEDTVAPVTLKSDLFVTERAPSKTGELAGLTPHSISLVLESAITIRHYFTVAEGVDLASYTVTATIGGQSVAASLVEATNVKPDAINNYARIDIENIPAHLLCADTIVTVTDGVSTLTINCSAVGYAFKGQNDTTDLELANLARAIANYAYEANEYNK